MMLFYAISAAGVMSAALAWLRPSMWSMFAAAAVNLTAAWLTLAAYF